MIDALAEDYFAHGCGITEEESVDMAIDWIDYNTLRSLPYIPEAHRPIIVFELEG